MPFVWTWGRTCGEEGRKAPWCSNAFREISLVIVWQVSARGFASITRAWPWLLEASPGQTDSAQKMYTHQSQERVLTQALSDPYSRLIFKTAPNSDTFPAWRFSKAQRTGWKGQRLSLEERGGNRVWLLRSSGQWFLHEITQLASP